MLDALERNIKDRMEAERQFLEAMEEQTDTISEQLCALKDIARIIYKHSPGIFKVIMLEDK